MNIFVLDSDIKKCAEYHCAKHTSKMVSEYAQILSTVIYETTGKIVQATNEDLYMKLYPKSLNHTIKPTHKSHPCVKWVMESKDNFDWLMQLLDALHDEWIIKFKHKPTDIHGTYYKFLDGYIEPKLPQKGMTKFSLAMPVEYMCEDPIQSYRNYYKYDKKHLHDWKCRQVPSWIL
jgi:hypothetical protein